ncbi:MAG: ABC transporter permease, partial [Candidatus Heimdallarchaeota archaeon]
MSVIDVEKTIRHSTKEDEILEQLKLVEGSNLWTITLRRMRKDQLGMFGLWLVLGLIAIAVIAFILQVYDNWFGLANPTADPWDLHNYYIEIWIPGTERYLRLIAHPKHIIAGQEGLAPSFQYPFGTDLLGHDIFSRMIFGTPLSLALGITGQLLTSFLGAIIGAISGFYGGLFDEVVQRINEVVMGLPDFILFIFAVALFGEVADLFDGGYYIVVLTILS